MKMIKDKNKSCNLSSGLIQSKRGILPIYNFNGGNNDRQEVSYWQIIFFTLQEKL